MAQDGQLVMADTRENAVFLIPGLIEESYLCTPFESTYSGGSFCVHRIQLAPISQEFHLAIAYLGNAFGVQDLAGPIVGSGIYLSTRKEGSTTNCAQFSGYHYSVH
jgi:hypothetical protein